MQDENINSIINEELYLLRYKTLVDSQWIIRCYVPESRTLHNHRCENLKFCRIINVITYTTIKKSYSNISKGPM
jgi:hypothetical protein